MAPSGRRRPSGDSPAPLCVIPARGGSKRFPRKNVAPLNGRPLIAYAIATALDSGIFDRVHVSTEDQEIAEIARGEGAEVLERPPELASDEARVVDVTLHALDACVQGGRSFETLCVIYPTAALMLPEDLQGAWNMFVHKRANSSMAVTHYYEHPLWALKESGQFLRPVFPKAMAQRQKLPEYTVDVGYFYFIKADVLRQRRSFYVPRLVGYPIPRLRAVDIDEPQHLRVAEALMNLSSLKEAA